MKRASSVSSRSFSTQQNGSTFSSPITQSSAVKGASLAFQASPTPPKPLINTYSGTNGALAAATRAGSLKDGTGGGVQSPIDSGDAYSIIAGKGAVKKKTLPSELGRQESYASSHSSRQSPSHIAATLAAARSTPAVPTLSSYEATAARQVPPRTRSYTPASLVRNDEESIPATNKLVELFEAKQRSMERPPEKKPRDIKTHSQVIVSPIPIRPSNALRLTPKSFDGGSTPQSPTDSLAKSSARVPLRNSPPSKAAIAAARSASPIKSSPTRTPTKLRNPPALPPPRRGIRQTVIKPNNSSNKRGGSREDDSDPDSSGSFTSAQDHLSRSSTLALSRTSTIAQSNTQPPALPARLQVETLAKPPPPAFKSRPQLPPVITRPTSTKPRHRSGLTADSLANAIVASSVASSRAPSPTKPRSGPTPPPRRHSKSYSLFAPSPVTSRAPSPQKPMRQTLRTPRAVSDDESSSKNRKHKSNHHHHHHHHPHGFLTKTRTGEDNPDHRAGRWADVISEAERKKYEGVWAANRGILAQFSPNPKARQEEVHALVVKDIWTRSKLSNIILEEIWELVEGQGRRAGISKAGQVGNEMRTPWLKREEFVVGLWLADQCLKGRKLPVEVSENVWGSVRRLMSGVTLR